MGFLNTISNSILGIVFPTKCILCKAHGDDLCLTCLEGSPAAERESANWIFPLYDYRNPIIKKSLWLFKYKGKKRLANVFAEILYGKILEELADLSVLQNFTNAILIPIPLSPPRRRERGYNQAELICREIIKLTQKDNLSPTPLLTGEGQRGEVMFVLENNILIKPKDTKHQAHIENRSERLKNLIGSFSVRNEDLIKNRNVILIDDITTTGATLAEAKKILKKCGARKVVAFTIAH